MIFHPFCLCRTGLYIFWYIEQYIEERKQNYESDDPTTETGTRSEHC